MNPTTIAAVVVIFLIFKFLTSKGSLKSDKAKELMASGGKVIDVRSPGEFSGSHFKGSINIPHGNISNGIKKAKIGKDTPIILYCASGSRSSVALSMLKSDGYTNVYNAGTLGRINKLLN